MAVNFDDAILAHSRWKSRLKKLVDGTSTEKIDTTTLGKDNHCDLGKWLEAERQHLKDDPDYKGLVSNHAEFHKSAAQIASMAEAGKHKEAQEALSGMTSSFTRASTNVISLLGNLRKRIK